MQFLNKGLLFGLLIFTAALQAQISVTIQVDQNVSCYGGSDGILTAIVSPAGSYTYAWSNGGSTATITDLVAGAYAVTVQNAAGGTAVASAVLAEPEELVSVSLTELPLLVDPVGFVDVETTGGTVPYSFFWVKDPGIPYSTQEDLFDAPAGVYSLTTTDANGCTATLSPVELIMVSGTKDAYSATLGVFPNPVSQVLTIDIPEGENLQVQVFDAAGKLVESLSLQGPRTTISVDIWPDGFYTLAIPALKKAGKVLVKH